MKNPEKISIFRCCIALASCRADALPTCLTNRWSRYSWGRQAGDDIWLLDYTKYVYASLCVLCPFRIGTIRESKQCPSSSRVLRYNIDDFEMMHISRLTHFTTDFSSSVELFYSRYWFKFWTYPTNSINSWNRTRILDVCSAVLFSGSGSYLRAHSQHTHTHTHTHIYINSKYRALHHFSLHQISLSATFLK